MLSTCIRPTLFFVITEALITDTLMCYLCVGFIPCYCTSEVINRCPYPSPSRISRNQAKSAIFGGARKFTADLPQIRAKTHRVTSSQSSIYTRRTWVRLQGLLYRQTSLWKTTCKTISSKSSSFPQKEHQKRYTGVFFVILAQLPLFLSAVSWTTTSL